jgi:prepilin-type N-terminal cleavage/methylation domain-containing protein
MENCNIIKKSSKLAFSLVEMSMVILIIGILIAGISGGADLYSDYRFVTAKNLTKNSRVGRIEDLEMWLETSSDESFATGTDPYVNLSSDPADGAKIGMWRDINPKLTSANRFNIFRNSVLDNQPTYTRMGINSVPALKFDNTDSLNTYTFTSRLNTAKFSVFLVMNHNNLGGGAYNFVFYSRGGFTGYSLLVQKLTSSNIQSLNYVLGNGGSWQGSASVVKSSEVPIIVTFVFDGVTSKLYRNGVEYSTSFSGSYNINGSVQTYLAPRGYLGEFIYFSRNLIEVEQKDIEKYLSKKWAINLN